MTLQIDSAARAVFDEILATLRSARLASAGRVQWVLSTELQMRRNAVSEWENRHREPTLEHLMQWSRLLGFRLVIVGSDGKLREERSSRRPGESWEIFERRRLAGPLRNRRVARGLTQEELGRLVGTSRDSINRWELTRVPPRPIAVVVWAQKLDWSLALHPVHGAQERVPRTPLRPGRCPLTRQPANHH